MKHNFSITLRDEKWDYLLDNRGWIKWYHEDFTLAEIKALIELSTRIEGCKYGHEIFVKYKNENVSISTRIRNITTKKGECVRRYLDSNWNK